MHDNFPTKICIGCPKIIYPCVLIMYSTKIVHKLMQPRKCLTGIPPWLTASGSKDIGIRKLMYMRYVILFINKTSN